MTESPKPSTKSLIIAFGIALFADLLQLVFFPLFIEGFGSPFDDVLDVAVAGVLTALLGWHWVFLPSAVFKLAPMVDVAPFWSMAVFFVAVGKGHRGAPRTDVPFSGTTLEHQPQQPH